MGKPKTFKCFECGKPGDKTQLPQIWCGVVGMKRFCCEFCFVRGYSRWAALPEARAHARKRLTELLGKQKRAGEWGSPAMKD